MRNDDRDPRDRGRGKRFLESVQPMIGLVTRMRRIERADGTSLARQRFDFGLRCRCGRRVVEPAREPNGTGAKCFAEPSAHGRQFIGCRWPLQYSHAPDAQRRVANQANRIDRRRAGLKSRQIIGKQRNPVEAQRREADAAIAYNHGRDALADLHRHFRIDEECAIIMGVDVDESGRQRLPGDVEFGSGRFANGTHGHDALAGDSNVPRARSGAGTIDDQCIAKNQIKHDCLSNRILIRAARQVLPDQTSNCPINCSSIVSDSQRSSSAS